MWELNYKESWTLKNWCFWTVVLTRRLSTVPWTARRSNQSILKEICPEYSLEGLMLKPNLQYSGHLMQRTDSLMDREAWHAAVHGVTKSRIQLSDWTVLKLGVLQNIAAAAAKSLQLCLTLCDPTDGSLPGPPLPGVLQARTLEWVAISFCNAWKWSCSVMSDSVTPWTAAYQAPPTMGFSRQEYWSGVPLPSPAEYCYTKLLTDRP